MSWYVSVPFDRRNVQGNDNVCNGVMYVMVCNPHLVHNVNNERYYNTSNFFSVGGPRRDGTETHPTLPLNPPPVRIRTRTCVPLNDIDVRMLINNQ